MPWKFLKPTFSKIALSIVFFVAFSWLWQFAYGRFIMDVSFYGIPLHFYTTWGPCQAGQSCSKFNGTNLFLDLIFWYILSTLILPKFQK